MPRFVWLLSMLSVFVLVIPNAQAVPPDFVDEAVVNVGSPTDFTWTPDGRMLITQQGGTMRVYHDGALLPTPALTLGSKVCSDFERGLLGVAVDPDFANNQFIYVYYTFNKFNHPSAQCPQKTAAAAVDTPVNRVSRFSLPNSNIIDLASEAVLVDNIPSPGGNHNGGDLLFGKDGYLYISIGDGGRDYATGDNYSGGGGSNDAARDPHVLLGKILRVTPGGGIPADNPFTGPNTEPCADDGFATPGNFCQETWAWGLRNPFRIALDPNSDTTRIFINDVGQGQREEIDAGVAGADYGWNCREGTRVNSTVGLCNPVPANMVDPIYEYGRDTGCASITGGAFVPNGIWPAVYADTYLFADYACGDMFVLSNNGTSWSATEFTSGTGSPVSMDFGAYGQTQALFYSTYANGGQIRRIRYTGAGNQAPTAMLEATPASGAAPLQVAFDASGSSDPEQGALIYLWDFGDGTDPISTTNPSISHTYTRTGSFEASVVVRDAVGQDSAPAMQTISVEGNSAPNVSIESPTPETLFAVGEPITFHASATDPEDGPIEPVSMTLRVILHHATHTHPFLTVAQTDTLMFNAPPPEDFMAASNSYLELQATATDAEGASTTITQTLNPNAVRLTFASEPDGAQLIIAGERITTPYSAVSWENLEIAVYAPTQVLEGNWYSFESWNDSGGAQRTLVTPAEDSTFTATFTSTEQLFFLPSVYR